MANAEVTTLARELSSAEVYGQRVKELRKDHIPSFVADIEHSYKRSIPYALRAECSCGWRADHSAAYFTDAQLDYKSHFVTQYRARYSEHVGRRSLTV